MSNFHIFIEMSNFKKRDSYIDAYIVRSKKNKATGLWEVQQTVEPPISTPNFPCPSCYKVCSNAGAFHPSENHTSISLFFCGYREHGISGPIQNSVLSKRFPVPFWKQVFAIELYYIAVMA